MKNYWIKLLCCAGIGAICGLFLPSPINMLLAATLAASFMIITREL